MLADRLIKEQRIVKKRNKDLKKLEQGDEYISGSEDEISPTESSVESDLYGSEYDQQDDNQPLRMEDAISGAGTSSPVKLENSPEMFGEEHRVMRSPGTALSKHSQQVEEVFNPLRFIALNLKELNEDRKRRD